MPARRKLRPAAWGGGLALILGLGVLADGLGLLRPRPPAARLIRELGQRWEAAAAYRAEISTGQWGQGAVGVPATSRQWYWKDRGELVLATQDMAGFRHAEHWQKDLWTYYQPGADLQVETRLAGTAEVPHAGWLVTTFPTVGDLVQALQSAGDAEVTGSEELSSGSAWIVECTPPMPVEALNLPESHPARAFYRRFFGRRWKVWLSQETGLPNHLIIPGQGSEPAARIGVENLKLGPVEALADWRTSVTERVKAPRKLRFACNLRNGRDLPKVRERIDDSVNAWRAPLMRRGSGAGTRSR